MQSRDLVVRNNAPNWPAMVSRRPSTTNLSKAEKDHMAVKSSLWMQSRNTKNNVNSLYQNSSNEKKFASKTCLLRQCQHCQVLYSNFHHCSDQS